MTQQEEEDILFQKVLNLKKERDLLYAIFEQLDKRSKDGYTCKKCKKNSHLENTINQYKHWRKND